MAVLTEEQRVALLGSPEIAKMLELAGEDGHELEALICPECNGALAGVVPACEHSKDDWCKVCLNGGVVYLDEGVTLPHPGQKRVMMGLVGLISAIYRDWGSSYDCEIGYAGGPTVPLIQSLKSSVECGIEDVTHFFKKDWAVPEAIGDAADFLEALAGALRERRDWYADAQKEMEGENKAEFEAAMAA